MKIWVVLLLAGCFAKHHDAATPDAGDPAADAKICGGVQLALDYVPPNLGIVLDRSCSMRQLLTGTQTTKWMAAVAAIDHALQSYATDVRWGLTLFPDTTGEACAQDANTVPIDDGKATAIQTLLDASLATTDPSYPSFPCVTNIDTGIESAALDPALADPAHRSYLMLVTDGAQSGTCTLGGGDAGTEAAVHALFHDRGIPTFVVGFGSEADATELTRLANKGGVPAQGATKFYKADTAADLDAVFQQIANQVVSCTYAVDQVPPDLEQTYVVFDHNQLVPRDPTHMIGWDFDPATMTFTMYGGYCDALKSHAVADIGITFGCPNPPIL